MEQENSNENIQETKKQRGAPKGKRPVHYVHAAIKNGKLVMGSYLGSEKETAKAFKIEFGVESEKALGPVRKVAEKKSQVSVKDSIRLESDQLLNMTETRIKGVYKGWNVIGNGIQETTVGDKFYRENELFRVILESRVNPDEKAKKPRIGSNDVIPAELIENQTLS